MEGYAARLDQGQRLSESQTPEVIATAPEAYRHAAAECLALLEQAKYVDHASITRCIHVVGQCARQYHATLWAEALTLSGAGKFIEQRPLLQELWRFERAHQQLLVCLEHFVMARQGDASGWPATRSGR